MLTNFHNLRHIQAYSRPIGNLQLENIISPPNTVCVTKLRCNILIITLYIFFRPTCLLPLIRSISILDLIYVNK